MGFRKLQDKLENAIFMTNFFSMKSTEGIELLIKIDLLHWNNGLNFLVWILQTKPVFFDTNATSHAKSKQCNGLIWTKSFSEYPKVICPIVFHPKNKSNHDIFFPWFDHFSCRLTTSAFFSIFSPRGHSTTTWTKFLQILTPNPLGHFTKPDYTYHIPFITWRGFSTDPPPTSFCPRSYWMTPNASSTR